MKNKILIFLTLFVCSISKIKAPSFFEKPLPEKHVETNKSFESKTPYSFTAKNNVDHHYLSKISSYLTKKESTSFEDRSKIESESYHVEKNKQQHLGFNFGDLFLKENRLQEEKSIIDRQLDILEQNILDRYKNKNVANLVTQEQADAYVKSSFQDVYNGCKLVLDQSNPPLNRFVKFVKAFNWSVSVTTKVCALKSQRFIEKKVSDIKMIAKRFNTLNKQDQEIIIDDFLMEKQQDINFLSAFEELLKIKEEEIDRLKKQLNQVEMQAVLQDKIDQFRFENQQIIKKLSSSDVHLNEKKEPSLILLQEQKESKLFVEDGVATIELQKQLNKLKAENVLLMKQLENTKPSSLNRLQDPVKIDFNEDNQMQINDGLGVQEFKNANGEVVSKKIFIIDQESHVATPVQEIIVKGSSIESDGSIKVVSDLYSLNESGVQLPDSLTLQTETFVFDQSNNKILKTKQIETNSGELLERIDYIPDLNFDFRKLYDVSLLGFKRNDQFTINFYQKTVKNQTEDVLIKVNIKDASFQVHSFQSQEIKNGIITLKKKIEMQSFDASGKAHGSSKVITEIKKLNQDNKVISKLVQINGLKRAVEYVYDLVGNDPARVYEEIVYDVSGNKLTENSRVKKEYIKDNVGEELIVDKDQNGVILRITKHGQDVAGLQGIYFDTILNTNELLDQLKNGVPGGLFRSQIEGKVDVVVDNYKKEIRANIAKQLDLTIESVKKKIPAFDDAQAQKYIDDFLSTIYKSYENKINLFIQPIKESFIKDLEIVSDQKVSENKKGNSPQKVAQSNTQKIHQKKIEDSIKERKKVEITEQVNNYNEDKKTVLLYEYIKSLGMLDVIDPGLRARYLQEALVKEVTNLVDQAMKSVEVKNQVEAEVQKVLNQQVKVADNKAQSSIDNNSNPNFSSKPAHKPPLDLIAEMKLKLQSRNEQK